MKIYFHSDIEGLNISNPITKSVAHIPTWFKNVNKSNDELSDANIKTCPGFVDYFKQGYVVSLWCDLKINLIIKNDKMYYEWSTPDKQYTFTTHKHEQFLYHVPKHVAEKTKIILKPDCPWKIITPKGYSVLQLPMYYNYSEDFEVLPGVLHTDVYHTINQQMCIFKEGEFLIKKGTPLAMYVPYKRDNFDLIMTDNYKLGQKIAIQNNIINSKFKDRFKNLIKIFQWEKFEK